MDATTFAAELEALERRGWEALAGPNGAAFYEDVMADTGVMVFPSVVLDKTAALDAMRQAAPWSTFELHDIRVTVADGVGMVVYRAIAARAGQAQYEALMSSVYVRMGDRWMLLLHQQSP